MAIIYYNNRLEKKMGEAWSSSAGALNFLRDDPNEHTPSSRHTYAIFMPKTAYSRVSQEMYFSLICQIGRIPEEKPMLNTKQVK